MGDTDRKVREFTEKKGDTTNMGRARTPEQYLKMKKAEEEGECIFCGFVNKPKWIIEGDWWGLKNNDYPYKNHQFHWLLILKEHHEDFKEISKEVWRDLALVLQQLENEFEIPAINFIMRFGDPDLRSSTIHHLHAHVQIPEKQVVDERRSLYSFGYGCELCDPASDIVEGAMPWAIKDWRCDKRNPGSYQFYELVLFREKTHNFDFQKDFPDLMEFTENAVSFFRIDGGGLVFRKGDPYFTNSSYSDHPYMTVYCPNGTGRVHASFVPPRESENKPPCKATFCKGFEGEELEELRKRMSTFKNL